MGNIRLYGSTSGYTELAPPAVAPDGVLSLPSGTGTIATEAFVTDDYLPIAGGKVLQIVRATDTTNRTTTSTSFVDVTGMSVTITPSTNTSTILVIATFDAIARAGSQTAQFQITNSANTALSGAESCGVDDDAFRVPVALIGYSAPATTSATTYKLRFAAFNSAGNAEAINATRTGTMYAIEVSA